MPGGIIMRDDARGLALLDPLFCSIKASSRMMMPVTLLIKKHRHEHRHARPSVTMLFELKRALRRRLYFNLF